MSEILIRGGRVIDPFSSSSFSADLLIREGRIVSISRGIARNGFKVWEADGKYIFPGFLDLHAHLREPGGEEAEDLESGLMAAVRGGYTAVCCMPNTEPPLDHPELVDALYLKARSMGMADLFPVGCITRGRKGRELADMGLLNSSLARVRAFSDDGDCVMDSGLMRRALRYSRALGTVIISHPEDSALSSNGQVNEGKVSYRLGLRGIPSLAEEVMVARDILLAEETGARLHLAHVSTARSVRLIREAKERGVPVTAEATPHHLILTEEDIPGYDANFKVKPPLRTKEDVEALREALADGTIDAVATDHAPHTLQSKEQEFDYAPFGISGLETSFSLLYTELVLKGELSLEELVGLFTSGPARVLDLSPPLYGGEFVEGRVADLVIFDPQASWTIDPSRFASKGKNTPFAGKEVKGKVVGVLKGGRIVYEDEALCE
ncbi:MAG: dihydroorotase [Candidatus Geothermincolales bacterium]